MKKTLIILFLFTLILNAKTFSKIEFQGDIDFISGEFDRDTLLKICHIEYPPAYKVWKSDPLFEEKQIDDFVDNYGQSPYIYLVQTIRSRLLMAKASLDTEIAELYARIDKPKASEIYTKKAKSSWSDLNNIKPVDVPWYRWLFE